MNPNSIPKLPKYIYIVLDLISRETSIYAPRKVLPNKIQQIWNLSDSLLQLVKKNGFPIHNDRVGWALTYLKQAELIDFPKRGSASITKNGKILLKKYKEHTEITVKDLLPIEAFNKFYNKKKDRNCSLKPDTYTNDLSPQKSNIMSVSLDKLIFADLWVDLLQAGYTVVNSDGVFSIVRNK
ncbi:TPA: winged helix-turn-helix domain-containing protein [Legionella pneumophila]